MGRLYLPSLPIIGDADLASGLFITLPRAALGPRARKCEILLEQSPQTRLLPRSFLADFLFAPRQSLRTPVSMGKRSPAQIAAMAAALAA